MSMSVHEGPGEARALVWMTLGGRTLDRLPPGDHRVVHGGRADLCGAAG